MKDGKNVTVTGRVDRAASGQVLSDACPSGGTPSPFYALVGEDGALESRAPREIRGKATDVGDDAGWK